MTEYTILIEMSNAQRKKGMDDFKMTLSGDLDHVRYMVYDMCFRNPELRRKHYQVYVRKGNKRIGALFPTRNEKGKLVYAWAEEPYTLKSPIYEVSKASGRLLWRIR